MFATSCSSQEQKINIFYVQKIVVSNIYNIKQKTANKNLNIFVFKFFLCCICFYQKFKSILKVNFCSCFIIKSFKNPAELFREKKNIK